MKILITGISGFIGTYLAKELSKSNLNVFGIDQKKIGNNIFTCDLLSFSEISHVISKNKFSWIVHLAALTSVNDSWKDPNKFIEINSTMTHNIFESLKKYSPKTQVILASSASVYGKQTNFPITEDLKPNPIDPYSISKMEQEKVTKEYPKIGTIIIRPFNQAGPGKSHLAISSFAKQIALCENSKNNSIEIGNLDTYRDYLDIRDTSTAIKKLINKGKIGEIYNVCSGQKRKMAIVLQQLLKLSHKEIHVIVNKDLIRPVDLTEFWGTHKKLTNDTKWEPSIPFQQTLLDTLNYWRNNL